MRWSVTRNACNRRRRGKGRDGRNVGALGVGAEGAARISLFLLFRCYSVTKSWKPLQEAAFRCNRIRNAALSATLQNHRPRLLLRDLRSLRRKKPQKPNSSRPAVTQFVTKSVTDDLLRQTESRWVNPPTSKGRRSHRPEKRLAPEHHSRVLAQLPVSSNLWCNPSPHPARYPKSMPHHYDEHKALFLPQR